MIGRIYGTPHCYSSDHAVTVALGYIIYYDALARHIIIIICIRPT